MPFMVVDWNVCYANTLSSISPVYEWSNGSIPYEMYVSTCIYDDIHLIGIISKKLVRYSLETFFNTTKQTYVHGTRKRFFLRRFHIIWEMSVNYFMTSLYYYFTYMGPIIQLTNICANIFWNMVFSVVNG